MTIIDFLIQALASHRNLISIDNHHIISTGKMWGKDRLVLAAQNLRDLRRQATQDLTLSIDDIPLRLQVSSLRTICFHHDVYTPIHASEFGSWKALPIPHSSGYSTRTRHSPCGGTAEPGCVLSARCTIAANSARLRRFCPTSSSVPTILRTIPVRKASAVKSQSIRSFPPGRTHRAC